MRNRWGYSHLYDIFQPTLKCNPRMPSTRVTDRGLSVTRLEYTRHR
jgi:hypothetical protein